MKRLCYNLQDLTYFFKELKEQGLYPVKFDYTNKPNRSLSQNALQHSIYGEISKYLISKGRGEWSAEVVKESLKNKFLGWYDKEFVDVITGKITVRQVLISTSKLDKGDAYHYTTQIIEWAESIGCRIKIPAKCDYRELMERQND